MIHGTTHMRERAEYHLSHLHGLITIDIRSTGYPSLVKLFLQLGDFLQTLRVTDQLLNALALLVRELYSDTLFGGDAFSRRGDVKGARLDTQNLGCEG
jgi:hypothetical protein